MTESMTIKETQTNLDCLPYISMYLSEYIEL